MSEEFHREALQQVFSMKFQKTLVRQDGVFYILGLTRRDPPFKISTNILTAQRLAWMHSAAHGAACSCMKGRG